ncbi:MAG: 50S ribosomal protein L29 [Halobacteriota archaeon]
MAILRSEEIRKMKPDERLKQRDDLTAELLRERALVSAGGAPENPGKSKELRRTIARIHTIIAEQARAQSR